MVNGERDTTVLAYQMSNYFFTSFTSRSLAQKREKTSLTLQMKTKVFVTSSAKVHGQCDDVDAHENEEKICEQVFRFAAFESFVYELIMLQALPD